MFEVIFRLISQENLKPEKLAKSFSGEISEENLGAFSEKQKYM